MKVKVDKKDKLVSLLNELRNKVIEDDYDCQRHEHELSEIHSRVESYKKTGSEIYKKFLKVVTKRDKNLKKLNKINKQIISITKKEEKNEKRNQKSRKTSKKTKR